MSRAALLWASSQWGDFYFPNRPPIPAAKRGRLVRPHAIDIAVLYVLADLTDKYTHRSWPSSGHIQERLGVSWRRQRQALELWQRLGLVEILERRAQRGRQTSNSYVLRLDRGKGQTLAPDGWPLAVDKSGFPVDKSGFPVDMSVDNSPDRPDNCQGGGHSPAPANCQGLDPIYPSLSEDQGGARVAQETNSAESAGADDSQSSKNLKESSNEDDSKALPAAGRQREEVSQDEEQRKTKEYLLENLRRVRRLTGV